MTRFRRLQQRHAPSTPSPRSTPSSSPRKTSPSSSSGTSTPSTSRCLRPSAARRLHTFLLCLLVYVLCSTISSPPPPPLSSIPSTSSSSSSSVGLHHGASSLFRRRVSVKEEEEEQERDAAMVLPPHTPLSSAPLLASASLTVWKNPYNLVHVIQTRFMQYQPHLTHLALARLELFRVFCLPLVTLHSSANSSASFLWMIRVDPELEETVTRQLLFLLKNTTNVLVIASNDNPAFRSDNPLDYPQQQGGGGGILLFGSLELWRSYYDNAQTHTLLETRLDADDGLANVFVEQLQQRVHQHYYSSSTTASAFDSPKQQQQHHQQGVRIYCVDAHLEWLTQPLLLQQKQQQLQVSKEGKQQQQQEEEQVGSLVGLRTVHCVTPGLTYVFPPLLLVANETNVVASGSSPASDADPAGAGPSAADTTSSSSVFHVPYKHHKIHKLLHMCKRNNHVLLDNNESNNPCYVRFSYQNLPMAIRARTITSAGMSHVLAEQQALRNYPFLRRVTPEEWQFHQEQAWHAVPALFGLSPQDVASVKRYLEGKTSSTSNTDTTNGSTSTAATEEANNNNNNNNRMIVQQALAGQCSPGHSCKDGSRLALEALLQQQEQHHDKQDGTQQAKAAAVAGAISTAASTST